MRLPLSEKNSNMGDGGMWVDVVGDWLPGSDLSLSQTFYNRNL